MVGASATIPHGNSLAASQSNYLLGNDPAHWRTHVPYYRQVVYSNLYPGIDAVFYGNGHLLKHDFVISPGGDYRQIRLHLSADAHASLDSHGELTIALPAGKLQMHKPIIYQNMPGGRRQRSGGFQVLAGGDITFTVRSYDSRRTLVIDPVLSFSTYLATQASHFVEFIATDNSGNNYLSGIALYPDARSVPGMRYLRDRYAGSLRQQAEPGWQNADLLHLDWRQRLEGRMPMATL